jgi:hypothetical protein
LATLTQPFVAPTFKGTLTSRAFNNDTSNPFGLTGVTFTYQFTNTDSDAIPTGLNRITVGDFSGFLTDMSHQPGTGVVPAFLDRGLAPGEEVGFSFQNQPVGQGEVAPGQTSAVLVVQTNSVSFVTSTASIIDSGVASVPALAPRVIVPEPASASLLTLGGAALIARRRKR